MELAECKCQFKLAGLFIYIYSLRTCLLLRHLSYWMWADKGGGIVGKKFLLCPAFRHICELFFCLNIFSSSEEIFDLVTTEI